MNMVISNEHEANYVKTTNEKKLMTMFSTRNEGILIEQTKVLIIYFGTEKGRLT